MGDLADSEHGSKMKAKKAKEPLVIHDGKILQALE